MELINIYPVGNMCLENTQKMHMYLTHLVEKHSLYARNAEQTPGYRILDNSLIELGGSVSVERVLESAEKIQADEIILPDVFKDGPATIKAVEEALAFLRKKYPKHDWPYKLMAVAQGKDEYEWLDCYYTLLNMNEVDVIGIPKVLATMHPEGRPYFVNTYCDLYRKPHHLLGLWYSFEELTRYNNPDAIRSCDTVLLGYFTKHGLPLSGVRPNGYTVDLENDIIDYTKLPNPEV